MISPSAFNKLYIAATHAYGVICQPESCYVLGPNCGPKYIYPYKRGQPIDMETAIWIKDNMVAIRLLELVTKYEASKPAVAQPRVYLGEPERERAVIQYLQRPGHS